MLTVHKPHEPPKQTLTILRNALQLAANPQEVWHTKNRKTGEVIGTGKAHGLWSHSHKSATILKLRPGAAQNRLFLRHEKWPVIG